MNKHNQILKEYRNNKGKYDRFTTKICELCENLLDIHGISTHSIVGRAKDIASLEKKIKREDKGYNDLEEITDLTGIRIITYFSDDVDRIAKLIEEEFVIDERNSVDKRSVLEADRFGYLSLHYVVELKEHQSGEEEQANFKNLKAEIQIRSILQHAWAEIEHDLGYKTEEKIPREIRRSFSRVAGLLETADIEFVNIRERIQNFEDELIEQLHSHPESVELTINTLKLTLSYHELIQEFHDDLGISSKSTPDNGELKWILQKLQFVSINNAGELIQSLSQYEKELNFIHDFYYNRLSFSHFIEVLPLYLIGKSLTIDSICNFFEIFSVFPKRNMEEEAKRLLLVIETLEHTE